MNIGMCALIAVPANRLFACRVTDCSIRHKPVTEDGVVLKAVLFPLPCSLFPKLWPIA